MGKPRPGLLSSLTTIALSVSNSSEFLISACEQIAKMKGISSCWIGVFDENSRTIEEAFQGGKFPEYANLVQAQIGDPSRGIGPTAMAIQTGTIQINQDTISNPNFGAWRDAALERRFLSSAALPLFFSGELKGVLAIYSNQRYFFKEEVAVLMEQIGSILALGWEALDSNERAKIVSSRMQERAKLYEQGLENSPLPAVIADDRGQIVKVNHAFGEVLGYSDLEVIGRPVIGLIAPQDSSEAIMIAKEFFRGERDQILDLPKRVIRRDGTSIYARVSATVVRGEDQQIYAFLVLIRDISEEIEAQHDLEQMESLLFLAAKHAPVRLIALNEDDEVVLNIGRLKDAAPAPPHPSSDEPSPATSPLIDLIKQDGELEGETFTISDTEVRVWSHHLKQQLGSKVAVAGIAIDVHPLQLAKEQLRKRASYQHTLALLSEEAIRERSIAKLVVSFLARLKQIYPAMVGVYCELDSDHRLRVNGLTNPDLVLSTPMAARESPLARTAISTSASATTNHLGDDPLLVELCELTSTNFTAAACLPILGRNQPSGLVLILLPDQSNLAIEESIFFDAVSYLFSRTFQEVEIEDLLVKVASTDRLTGLGNKAAFEEDVSIQLEKTTDTPVCIAILDLLSFKDVNRSLGHEFGDRLLVGIADRLRFQLHPQRGLYRLDGDRFGILILMKTPTDFEREAEEKTQAILNCIADPAELEGIRIVLRATAGLACSFPSDLPPRSKVRELVRRSEIALREAKKMHVPYLFYTDQLSPTASEAQALLVELTHAIASEELEVFFQPKVLCTNLYPVGLEALLRWRHPTMGMIPPDRFIPLAEVSGLIKPITNFVLTKSVQFADLIEQYMPQSRVSVNLSPASIMDPTYLAELTAALDSLHAKEHHLEFEITETAILEDPLYADQMISELSSRGITFSIDDFGTGFSSLAHLQRLSVQLIKIDKSFVQSMQQEPSSMAIVKSVVGLGHALGLSLVAEGVETEADLNILRELGCEQFQGYLAARPMPASEALAWIIDAVEGKPEEMLP